MTIDSTPEGIPPSETPSDTAAPSVVPAQRRGVALPLLVGIALGAGAAAGGYFLNERTRGAIEQDGAAATEIGRAHV